ncbi:hypothetical protein PLANPX_5270 [Lacipirellula parvula]|uniref:Uncharacterized protein n=1 Tax=Lacipirellula parvula TaxID=2650471 RepID=A0A5K7XGU0_9BACT|nr:hypothetical protein PLANPX_5270 [Lacipirellula parvula]
MKPSFAAGRIMVDEEKPRRTTTLPAKLRMADDVLMLVSLAD